MNHSLQARLHLRPERLHRALGGGTRLFKKLHLHFLPARGDPGGPVSLLRQYVELLSRLQSAAIAPQEQTNSISPCQGAGPRRNANLSVETNGDGQRRGKGDAAEKKETEGRRKRRT